MAPPAADSPPRNEVPPPKKPVPAPPPPGTPPADAPVTIFEALTLLGISPSADRATLDQAFRERSMQCHPDKVAHLDPDFQALAVRKFQRLLEAYEMLTETD